MIKKQITSLKFNILIFVFLTAPFIQSQEMKNGFRYLETGRYDKAVSFFKMVLSNYPDNKTARLCYGRAVGLNGDTKETISIFTDLLKVYPNDFEIRLNYAESLLWDKNYDVAKPYYEDLIKEDGQRFPALLGYANTLSNLKIYDKALDYVNRALEVSPNNTNALISKKYIYLGYAYQNQQQQNYEIAEQLLKENLSLFKNDLETLINLANVYLITKKLDKAERIYTIIGSKDIDRTISLNGLTLVKHLKNNDKEALKISAVAYNSIPNLKDLALIRQTQERYIQALMWNRKYKDAQVLISKLIVIEPNANWILTLRATLNSYKGDFKKSIIDYNKVLLKDSSSFDGNLGKAYALKALGDYNGAFESANNTVRFYNNQKDAIYLIDELNAHFTPFLKNKISYGFDNEDNEAYAFQSYLEFPISTKFKWLANYEGRTTHNSLTDNKAMSNDFYFGLAYQLRSNIIFRGTAGITAVKVNTHDYQQLLTDLSFSIKPFKLQVLDIGYEREVQNYNADLLGREIVMNNFYANYDVSTTFNVGWFTQYYYTSQSDNLTKNSLFTSLYYNISRKPSLKVGFNYQYLSFKNQIPSLYFNPERLNAYEVFLNLNKNEVIFKPKDWFYELTAAKGYQFVENNPRQNTSRVQGKLGYKFTGRSLFYELTGAMGYQIVEDNPIQSTYRIQGKMGYRFTKQSLLNIYGIRGNIASTTVAGFTFTEIGLRFEWYLFDNPMFRE